jgi:tRNA(Ile)-lysidine synthase
MIRFRKDMLDKSKPVIIGFSAGADSLAAYHFLLNGGWNIRPLFINHFTPDCVRVLEFIHTKHMNNVIIEKINHVPNLKSKEEYWRKERLRIFSKYEQVITAHHLNDAVETWLFSSINGNPKLPMWDNGIVKRPFLQTKKQDFIDYCFRHKLEWVEDKSNDDLSHPRNRIRHETMRSILKINPGIEKTIFKKLDLCR